MVKYREKLAYFIISSIKMISGMGYECPSCGCIKSNVVDRKYLVTTLRRCEGCNLLFRAPITTQEEYNAFYQKAYSEGFTTDVPSKEELEKLKNTNFINSQKDYSKYIDVLTALGCTTGNSLLDYGCSWGYGSWQFNKKGFKVTAFEISEERCQYAKKNLGIDAYSTIDKLQGHYDIFFSAHVLEHIPAVRNIIKLARQLIKPGGWFVAFTPNGSETYRIQNPKNWHRGWGFVHPLVIDANYYSSQFSTESYLIDSSPYKLSAIREWSASAEKSVMLDLGRAELLVAVRF